jgi:pimeloyl-ACP methyl ester carboxylesterase
LSNSALADGARSPAPRWPDGYFTVSDGSRLHYVEAGAGTPVILIHGARGSAIGNWFSNGIAPRLAETNKVYALDMRGHGLSEGNSGRGPFNHNVMHLDILEFMDQMGIEKAHMAGYSMGAGVLTQLLMIAPERFITCCFQGGGITETPEWRDKVPADKVGRDPDQAKADEMVRQRRLAKGEEVGNNFSDGPARPSAWLISETQNASAGTKRARDARRGPWSRMSARMAENGGPPPEMQEIFRKREEQLAKFDLSRIDFPMMAINGEFDRPLAKTHRLWRQASNFTNLVLPGKGHLTAMMPGFIPDAYIDGFAAFVARNNPKT